MDTLDPKCFIVSYGDPLFRAKCSQCGHDGRRKIHVHNSQRCLLARNFKMIKYVTCLLIKYLLRKLTMLRTLIFKVDQNLFINLQKITHFVKK